MNHFWQKLCASLLLLLAISLLAAVSLYHSQPEPPQTYLGHDAANPWGGK